VVSWRMPNTYPTGGVRRGTATQIPRDPGQPRYPPEGIWVGSVSALSRTREWVSIADRLAATVPDLTRRRQDDAAVRAYLVYNLRVALRDLTAKVPGAIAGFRPGDRVPGIPTRCNMSHESQFGVPSETERDVWDLAGQQSGHGSGHGPHMQEALSQWERASDLLLRSSGGRIWTCDLRVMRTTTHVSDGLGLLPRRTASQANRSTCAATSPPSRTVPVTHLATSPPTTTAARSPLSKIVARPAS